MESKVQSTIDFLSKKYDVKPLPEYKPNNISRIRPLSEYTLEELEQLYPETI